MSGKCTAPVRGHRSAETESRCPKCGGDKSSRQVRRTGRAYGGHSRSKSMQPSRGSGGDGKFLQKVKYAVAVLIPEKVDSVDVLDFLKESYNERHELVGGGACGHELCELFYELYKGLDSIPGTSIDELLEGVKGRLSDKGVSESVAGAVETRIRKLFSLIEGGNLIKVKITILLAVCVICSDLNDCPVPLDGEIEKLALAISVSGR